MPDPFLAAHLLKPGVYTLAGRAPISIRDQIFRGQLLFHRLWRSKQRILAPETQLLVVGAGVAGVTVALLAAKRRVRVDLVDAAQAPFSVQRACHTRWIDPVQYDWPAAHASKDQWPVDRLDPKEIPLGFKANFADVVAGQWNNELTKQCQAKSGYLQALFSTKLAKLPQRVPTTTGPVVEAELIMADGSRSARQYAVAVIARGVAQESTVVRFVQPNSKPLEFQGRRFWSDDNFTDPHAGLNAKLAHGILVSGSGDGALQDFIRLATGRKRALDVIAAIDPHAHDQGLPTIPEKFLLQIHDAEQEAQRALLWSTAQSDDHVILQRLHDFYKRLLDDLETSGHWTRIKSALFSITKGRPLEKLRLFHPCTHFTPCYSLNHFVVLLLDRYIDRAYHVKAIREERSVLAVEPWTNGSGQVHACGKECWGPPHNVRFRLDAHCLLPRTPAHPPGAHAGTHRKTEDAAVFDGVVIRHGLKQHTQAAPRRHMLPLHYHR